MKRALSRVFNCAIAGVLCCAMVPMVALGVNNDSSNAESAEQGSTVSEDKDAVENNTNEINTVETDIDLESLASQDPSTEESPQIALYANSSDLGISVNYDRANIRCGVPIKFTVNASGGRGKYKYRMDSWELQGEGYWPSVLDPSSWTNKHQDSNVFELTFFASGTYKIRFSAMESNACGDGPYLTSRVPDGDVWVTINDPNYPTKEKVADRIASECKRKNFSTDYEKALWLHDWLLNHCEYDIRYCNPEGALVRGEGNCEAYHGAFMMLLERVGIPCGRITGNGHVWTAAQLDGDWCQIDVTWDDYPQLTGYSDLKHLYFGLDDKLMGFAHSDHTGAVAGYESNTLKNHYYIKSGEIKKYSDQYASKIQDKLNNGAATFSLPIVETYWADSYNNIIQSLVAYDLSNKIWRSPTVKYKFNVSYVNHALSFQGYELDPMKYLDPGWNQDGYGNWRYGDKEGNAVVGWLQLGSNRYYLDPQTGIMCTGLQTIDDKKYFFRDAPYGNMLTGVQKTSEGVLCFNANGTTSSGWIKSNGYWYYFDPGDDNRAAIGWKTIGSRTYYLHSDSTMAQGWNKIGDDWYYFVGEGAMQKGWLQNSGGWYYLDPSDGAMVSGFKDINGNVYYLDPTNDSRMATGWKNVDGKWYYLDPSNDSRMATGWKKLSGGWYYLDPDDSGAMATGWKTIGNRTYYLDPANDSRMVTGWKEIGGNWHYFITEGTMQKGWVSVGGAWYYLDPTSGIMQTGWLTLDNSTYYLRPAPNGSMITGFQTIDGKRYAFAPAPNGQMIKGQWYKNPSDGYWYWLDKTDGHMATSEFINDGIGDSYVGSDGRMVTGWLKLDGKEYYFNSAGYMQRSKWIGQYWVGEDGAWVPNKR